MNAIVLAGVPRTPLEDVLTRRACEWARAVAPDRWTLAETLPERLDGPLLIAGILVPRLAPVHAAVARLDLEAGADVTLGPTFAGGLYLIGMREPRPELVPADWQAPTAFSEAIGRARAAGLELGWLRMERALASEADRHALRSDPLVSGEVRTLL
jgi:hypothetical protein